MTIKRLLLISLLCPVLQGMAQTVTTYPYIEDFNKLTAGPGQQIPPGWTALNLNADPAVWDVLANSATFTKNARSAPNSIHMSFSLNNPCNDWLFTPPLQVKAGKKYKLRFWYRNIAFGSAKEKMKIHTSTGPTRAQVDTVMTLWNNDEIISDEFIQDSAETTATSNGILHFVFHAYSDPEQFLLLVDDVEVLESGSTPVKEADELAVSVSPNPVRGDLQVTLKEAARFYLFDATGKQQFERVLSPGKNDLDVSDLPVGLYFYRLSNKQDQSAGGRLLLCYQP
jgi:Secretion system C-terminal sorting domain/Cleaved Adhesin Domain